MEKVITAVVLGLVAVAIAVALGALMAWPVMLLWNDTVVAVFGAKSITFLQAWGLLILSGILFNRSSAGSKS